MPHFVLINDAWHNGVNVQVRVGNDISNPEGNPIVKSDKMSFQESWPFDTGSDDLFWRRDSEPDSPDGNWIAWQHLSSAIGDFTQSVGIE
jgi:hypothetical protein